MELKDLIKSIEDLEVEMGWKKTSKTKIIEFIKQDARLINLENIKHKGVDLLIEVLQLIKRTDIDLDSLLIKHLKEIKIRYKAGHVKNNN